MAEINCTVDSCHYWGSGNRCRADSIMVRVNPHGKQAFEVGRIGGEAKARRSVETCCETFRPKDDAPGPGENFG